MEQSYHVSGTIGPSSSFNALRSTRHYLPRRPACVFVAAVLLQKQGFCLSIVRDAITSPQIGGRAARGFAKSRVLRRFLHNSCLVERLRHCEEMAQQNGPTSGFRV